MPKPRRTANGQAIPYQRASDKRWCVSLTPGYDTATGKPIRKTLYGATSAEVAKKKAQYLADLENPAPKREEVTVKQLFEEYLLIRRRDWAPRTYASAESTIRLHILPTLGDVRLSALDTRRIALWLQRSPQARTMQIARGYLHSACQLAMQWDWIEKNPVALTSPVKRPPVSKPPEMSTEAIWAILKAVEGTRYSVCAYLMAGCGLRISEALGLVWDNWDETAGVLRIEAQIGTDTGTYKGEARRMPLKTKRSARIVSVPHLVAPELRRHRAEQQREIEAEAARGGTWGNTWGLVITRPGGAPSNRSIAAGSIKQALKRAGIDGISPHDLRHGYASILVETLPPTVVADTLGHSLQVLMQTYAHKLAGRQNMAAIAMDAAMRGIKREEEKQG
jgi:integrase